MQSFYMACCRSQSSGSYAPGGLFKNTGYMRNSFRRASYSKKHEQALIGDTNDADSLDRGHSTFQMVNVSKKRSEL